ncbi:MAG: class I SAM-dependent methyltransferase [Planctomycetota bacterium]
MNWYARIAPFYNLICRPLYAQLRAAAVDALQLSGSECVVEIGCGTGLNIAALSKNSRQVIAVDCTAKMLDRAPQCFDNVEYVLGDSRAIASDSADAVLLCQVLNVTDDWRSVLDDAKRIVKAGGRIVIADVRPASGWLRFINGLAIPIADWSGAGNHRRNIWQECEGVTLLHRGFFCVRRCEV